jgi:hypothetical protein
MHFKRKLLAPLALTAVRVLPVAAAQAAPPSTLGVEMPQTSRNWAGYAAVRAGKP